MKKLLIVESPAKAKTIAKYLGGEFSVKSSVGHIRDLPKKGGLAIKIAPVPGKTDSWTFEPTYEVSPEKKKVVSELKAAAKAADEIYLAPDPDREGEAIAWHLNEVLSRETKGKRVMRVTYNEITKSAVKAAVENPGEIDLARVDAQQARRILDRLVGFQVSPFLWKYLPYGRFLSAGRVQSVALRLIVERERAIRSFKPEKYWIAGVEASSGGTVFKARLARIDGQKAEIRDSSFADSVMKDLEGAGLKVLETKDSPKTRRPHPPFTTSTLQQAASSFCGFSPHRTMGIAQKLYEAGLITYMRTDSVNIAQSARADAADFIAGEFGREFLPEKANFFKSKAGAQEAHEAIRPTDVRLKPEAAGGLDAAAQKLYGLIWRRFVASQMGDAKLSLRTVSFAPVKESPLSRDYLFTASATSVVFEGFLKVMPQPSAKKSEQSDADSDDAGTLPPLSAGDRPEVVRWLSERKETKPPARYSEAALVKALEENGVGRPSTYAQTIETIVNRKYATRESRQLAPTKCGEEVNDWLVKHLPDLFDVGYTAKMESALDKVESGGATGAEMLSGFYSKFTGWLAAAKEPPPNPEKFRAVFALLDEVKEWRPAEGSGRRVRDDRAFVESVREQMEKTPERLSEKQLRALASVAASYRDQIADADARLAALGWTSFAERAKDAPPPELVRECLDYLERAGRLAKDRFLGSIAKQVERGRALSPKQFAVLARIAHETAEENSDGKELAEKLAKFAPPAPAQEEADPVLPELVAMLGEIKTWKEPVKRGKRVFDDRAFAESLQGQFEKRKSLTPKQTAAMKKLLASYRDQIADFGTKAEKFGISSGKDGARKGKKPRN